MAPMRAGSKARRRWCLGPFVLVLAAMSGTLFHGVTRATAVDAATSSGCPVGTLPLDVRLRPDHGPVGTRVHISGRCFRRRWRRAAFGLFLLKQFQHPHECELIIGGDKQQLTVGADRRGTGVFYVGRSGQCSQQDYRRRATPGVYSVGIYCHACFFAQFRITRD